jgi:hypothetical protein
MKKANGDDLVKKAVISKLGIYPKPIRKKKSEELNLGFEVNRILEVLWILKDYDKVYFKTYGKFFIGKLVQQFKQINELRKKYTEEQDFR